jgi:hypothetical protein
LLLCPSHEMSGFVLPQAPIMMYCLTIGLKQ